MYRLVLVSLGDSPWLAGLDNEMEVVDKGCSLGNNNHNLSNQRLFSRNGWCILLD